VNKPKLAGLHARVYGKVQGVGFRYSTVMKARHLNLSGYARNMPDSSVEVLAEGARENLESLLGWLNRGPSSAVVTKVDHRYVSYGGTYRSFGLEY